MSRFFVPSDNIDGEKITVCGSDAHHIAHVLRMEKGDSLTVCDMGRREHLCIIEGFSRDEVYLRITESRESKNEPDVCVTLYQGLPKGDKLEQIIQKAVELGVSRVVPVKAERSIAKVNDSFGKKLERYNAISLAAAKQCGRAAVPKVDEPVSFSKMCELAASHEEFFICYEGDGVVPLYEIATSAFSKGVTDIGFYIGPEGGVSASELDVAKQRDITFCGLGSRILRTETASGCVLSALMLLSGNLQ